MSEATEQLRELSKQRTKEVLNQPGSIQRFAPSPLAQINPAFARTTSFPPSMANPFAAGACNNNAHPALNTSTTKEWRLMLAGHLQHLKCPLVLYQQELNQKPFEFILTARLLEMKKKMILPISASDQALERINEMRIAQGQEPFESMAEFQADLRRQIGIGSEGGWLQSLRWHGWDWHG